jgi:glycosyltransferase involved in cell wall biosynthesis
MITVPSPEDAKALVCKERSADFGRSLKVPILIPPDDPSIWKTPEDRINNALWPQGQIALEFQPGLAREKQFELLKMRNVSDYFDPAGASVAAACVRADQLPEEANPTVAVVTRTKNRPLLLERAARSVANQTYAHYLWVVVNDGGDEQAAREVVEQAAIDPRKIIFINNSQSRGMEAASNIGIRACQSAYVVIHDDDDSWEPEFLKRTVAFLQMPAGARYGGVITQSTYISEEIKNNEIIERGRWSYQNWVRNVQLAEMACSNMFAPIAFLFRRSVYEEVGGYNEALPVLGDWHFNIAFLLKADIAVINEPLAYYHHRDRGAVEVYANSVIGARAKHEEFNAIVRNQFLRELARGSSANLVVAMGYMTNEIRNQADRMRKTFEGVTASRANASHVTAEASNGSGQGSSLTDLADLRWTLLQVMSQGGLWQRLAPRGSQVHADMTWGELTPILKKAKIKIKAPTDFDDALYLTQNRDVAPQIENGTFGSGYEHYVKYGRDERRARPVKV